MNKFPFISVIYFRKRKGPHINGLKQQPFIRSHSLGWQLRLVSQAVLPWPLLGSLPLQQTGGRTALDDETQGPIPWYLYAHPPRRGWSDFCVRPFPGSRGRERATSAPEDSLRSHTASRPPQPVGQSKSQNQPHLKAWGTDLAS